MAARRQAKERGRTRVPVSGLRDIMTVFGKDEEFVYRWVVDDSENGSRILKYIRGGYDLAERGDHIVGDESVYQTKDGASIIRIPSGNGKFSYLMRIKKEWYDEDQKAKADQINEVEDTIMRTGTAEGNIDFGQYGEIKINKG